MITQIKSLDYAYIGFFSLMISILVGMSIAVFGLEFDWFDMTTGLYIALIPIAISSGVLIYGVQTQ